MACGIKCAAVHPGADRVNHASDLMARDAREGKFGPLPFDGETVAVAHTAGLDTDTHLAPRRLRHIPLDELEELIVEAWLTLAPKRLAKAYVAEHFPDPA